MVLASRDDLGLHRDARLFDFCLYVLFLVVVVLYTLNYYCTRDIQRARKVDKINPVVNIDPNNLVYLAKFYRFNDRLMITIDL